MARMIDADRLAEGLTLHHQPTDQKHETDRHMQAPIADVARMGSGFPPGQSAQNVLTATI